MWHAINILVAAAAAPRVAILVKHAPMTCGTADSLETVQCNLGVYANAIALAANHSADLIVLPEAYGLSKISKTGYWEALFLSNATTACESANASTMPVQKTLSCLARAHGIAIAYNVFATRDGAKRITEIVVDAAGGLRATYDKVHLFPIKEAAAGATAGTNAPTSFDLLGRRWGIIICYEGVFPHVPGGNYDQMDSLKAQNATDWIWSIGGMVPINALAKGYAKKYGVDLAATQDASVAGEGRLICGGTAATDCPATDVALAPASLPSGYSGAPFVRIAVLA
jgi:predicted amidohydrolase